MKKLKIFFFIFTILFSNTSYLTADPDGLEDKSYLNAKNSDFKKGNDSLKKAIKYKKKNNLKKSSQQLEKAIKYFVSANRNIPNNIEILKLLGLSYYLAGDTIMSEIYYLQALEIDPKNYLTNQRLGELYFNTKKIELANERLKLLKNCDCKEFIELRDVINGTRKSDY